MKATHHQILTFPILQHNIMLLLDLFQPHCKTINGTIEQIFTYFVENKTSVGHRNGKNSAAKTENSGTQ